MTAWTRTVAVQTTDDGVFIPHADCTVCGPERRPHDGEHLVPVEYAGQALCPASEYDDPAVAEEMAWHALESALKDAGLLEEARGWEMVGVAVPQVGEELTVTMPAGVRAVFRARTDAHLDEQPTVDLSCTLSAA